MSVSAEAAAHGVRPGMRRGGVSAVLPTAILLKRDTQKEQMSLNAIASVLLQFTPEVAFVDDLSLVLNVTSSLRLFNGYLALCHRLQADIQTLGFTALIGTAPTAMAAWMLSSCRSCNKQSIQFRTIKINTMVRQLDQLPCELLPAAKEYRTWLRGIGCRTLGQLRCLPRAGLQRRTNERLLNALDKCYGSQPEMFEWIKPPLTFFSRIETHERIEQAEALLIGAQRLILQLIGWLISLQQAVTCFVLGLEHERGRTAIPHTEVVITLTEPAWRQEHLIVLIKEHLGRLVLIAPVIALSLRVTQMAALQPYTDSLLPIPGGRPEDFRRLLELLISRLGSGNVLTFIEKQDHRPEEANRWLPIESNHAVEIKRSELSRRPALLFAEPIQLSVRHDRPFYGSALKLISPPERIEAGWFDEKWVARDYFIAQDNDAKCYWIYLERSTDARWFLHGLFA